MALPVGFYGSLQWIGWLSLLDEVALNHWNTHLFRPMVPSLILKILGFIVHDISRGNSRILILSQSPDLLSWFYVYLSDFGLICNLIHHLVLYPVSARTLERIATTLPPSLTSLLTTCGSLHLVVTTCG